MSLPQDSISTETHPICKSWSILDELSLNPFNEPSIYGHHGQPRLVDWDAWRESNKWWKRKKNQITRNSIKPVVYNLLIVSLLQVTDMTLSECCLQYCYNMIMLHYDAYKTHQLCVFDKVHDTAYSRPVSTGLYVTYKCWHLIENTLASMAPKVCLQQLLHSIVINLKLPVFCQETLGFLDVHEEFSCEGIPMLLRLESWRVKILGTDRKVSSSENLGRGRLKYTVREWWLEGKTMFS